MLNEKLKNKNGITLIALVVTIVVLLILAGVTIQMVFSDNGIIKRAQGAADAQKEAQDKDSLATMMAGYEVERLTSSKTLLDYFTEQKTKGDISSVTANGETGVLVTLNNGAQYKVNEDGTITPNKGENLPLAADEVAYTDSNGNKYSWEHINEFSASILSNANSVTTNDDGVMQATGTMNGNTVTIPVGTQMTVQVTQSNGTKQAYKVRVLGFKYDDLTSGGKAGITFDFVDSLLDAPMDGSGGVVEWWGGSNTDSNDGGCELRGTLNSTTLASLNNKDYIKAVNKTYYLGNWSAETRTKSDKLWLLACSEIWPQNSVTDPHYALAPGDETGEKGQYPLYKTLVGSKAYSNKNSNLVKKLNNSSNIWWLRSPYFSSSGQFCNVDPGGGCGNGTPGYVGGVAPGFCI